MLVFVVIGAEFMRRDGDHTVHRLYRDAGLRCGAAGSQLPVPADLRQPDSRGGEGAGRNISGGPEAVRMQHDALTSQDLAVLVSQLQPLPEAAETVAA